MQHKIFIIFSIREREFPFGKLPIDNILIMAATVCITCVMIVKSNTLLLAVPTLSNALFSTVICTVIFVMFTVLFGVFPNLRVLMLRWLLFRHIAHQ